MQLRGLLRETVTADHVYNFLLEARGNALNLVPEWYTKDTESRRSRVPRLDPTDFLWRHAQFDKGEPVVVVDVDLLSVDRFGEPHCDQN